MSFDTPSMRCRECKYWWPLAHAATPASRDKSLRGQCRRYAPPVHLIGASDPELSGTRKPAWAIISKDDWCGEFVHRDFKASF